MYIFFLFEMRLNEIYPSEYNRHLKSNETNFGRKSLVNVFPYFGIALYFSRGEHNKSCLSVKQLMLFRHQEGGPWKSRGWVSCGIMSRGNRESKAFDASYLPLYHSLFYSHRQLPVSQPLLRSCQCCPLSKIYSP